MGAFGPRNTIQLLEYEASSKAIDVLTEIVGKSRHTGTHIRPRRFPLPNILQIPTPSNDRESRTKAHIKARSTDQRINLDYFTRINLDAIWNDFDYGIRDNADVWLGEGLKVADCWSEAPTTDRKGGNEKLG